MNENIQQFNVSCKKCGSTNVSLSGYCGQNTGFGYLNCEDCPNEESSEE
jgi:ribosomal protein S27E